VPLVRRIITATLLVFFVRRLQLVILMDLVMLLAFVNALLDLLPPLVMGVCQIIMYIPAAPCVWQIRLVIIMATVPLEGSARVNRLILAQIVINV